MSCLRALPPPPAPPLPSARCPWLCIGRGDSPLGVWLPRGPGWCPVGSKAAPWGPAPEGRGLQRLPTWARLPLEGSARGQGWAKVKPDGLGAPRGRRAIRHRYLPCRQITNTFLSEGLAATGLRALMPPSCGHTAWGWGRGSAGAAGGLWQERRAPAPCPRMALPAGGARAKPPCPCEASPARSWGAGPRAPLLCPEHPSACLLSRALASETQHLVHTPWARAAWGTEGHGLERHLLCGAGGSGATPGGQWARGAEAGV